MHFNDLDEAAHHFLNSSQRCRELWLQAIWPDGIQRCGHCYCRLARPYQGGQYFCKYCRRWGNERTATILQGSHIDIVNWLTVAWACVQVRWSTGRQIASALRLPTHHSSCRLLRIIRRVVEDLRYNDSEWDAEGSDRFELLLSALANGPRAREAA